jgi:hypothetical protein
MAAIFLKPIGFGRINSAQPGAGSLPMQDEPVPVVSFIR